MPDANIVGSMQNLGFSEYEARTYVTLLQHSPVTGYELAKLSGIPRPNIYSVLPRLEERGAVVRLDTPHGARDAPVPPGELTRRLGDRFRQELASAREALAGLGPMSGGWLEYMEDALRRTAALKLQGTSAQAQEGTP